MLVCVRWYGAYPLSFPQLEEMMQERGVFVDHSTVHRWAMKFLPVMALIFRRRKRPVGTSWRMDETYIKVDGQWKGLYRAVDKSGTRWTFCSPPNGTMLLHGAIWSVPSTYMNCLIKSPSTKVEQTRRPFAASMPMPVLLLNCACPNISTTSWSKTTEQ
jgi:hypothetical protein